MSKITQYVRHLAVVAIATLLAQCAWADVTVTPKLLVNFNSGTETDVDGWINHTQADGGTIPKTGTLTDNGLTFAVSNKGNFGPYSKPTSGTPSEGTYVDIFGNTHASLIEEVETSLGLSSGSLTEDVYFTGLMNAGQNGNTATISGLDTSSKYVIYIGFGLTRSGVNYTSGMTLLSNGYGNADSLEYVSTVANGNVVKATEYTSFAAGTAIIPGAHGLMIVRLNGISPAADGTVKFTLNGDRSGVNFVAVGLMEGVGPVEAPVAEVGTTRYSSLSDAITAAQEGEVKTVTILTNIEDTVEVPEGVTLAMTLDARVTGVITGSGTVSLNNGGNNQSRSITNLWFPDNKLAGFTGTLEFVAGRFSITELPAAVTVKVNNGAQAWAEANGLQNHFILSGNGWTGDTADVGHAALRLDNRTFGNGAVLEFVKAGTTIPAVGAHNSDMTINAKLVGTDGCRILNGIASKVVTIDPANLSELTGEINLGSANTVLKFDVAKGETVTISNVISGTGKIMKAGAGTLELTANNTLTGGLTISEGTVVGTVNTVSDGTIDGAGILIPTNDKFPGTAKYAETWTGTVWIKNYGSKVLDLKDWAKADTTLRLTNVSGWLRNTAPNQSGPILELVDEGENVALHLTDGSAYFFNLSGLKGSGTLKISGADAGRNRRYAVNSVTDFTGSVIIDDSMTNARVLLGGADENPTAAGAIVIRTAVTTTGTLSAKNGIVLATETATLTVPAELATAPTTTVSGKKVVFDAETKTYSLADNPTDLPGAEKLPEGVSTSEYNAWAAKNGITSETSAADATTAATAFVMGVTVGQDQTIAQAAALKADEMLKAITTAEGVDLAALLATVGEEGLVVTTDNANLTVKLVPTTLGEEVQTSAKLFKLSIELK